MRRFIFSLCLTAILGLSTLANADLTTIGSASYGGNSYNLIYDADRQITWLDNTKGNDTWQNQVSWAVGLGNSMSVTLNPGYTTTNNWATGWRLPTTVDGVPVFGINGETTGGLNITTSEMGHLYYAELDNKGQVDVNGNFQPDYGLVKQLPFTNLLPIAYWSGTASASDSSTAWFFNSYYGSQFTGSKGLSVSALAVHDGNVSPVPIPGALLLFAPGLAGLGLLRRSFIK